MPGDKLCVLTCMDPRIDPLPAFGLPAGEAYVLRNAGARVTDEVLRTLVVAEALLDVGRLMVVAHTDCRMAIGGEEQLHAAIAAAGGPDTRSLTFGAVDDQERVMRADLARVQAWPYVSNLQVEGFRYHLDTGELHRLV